MTASSYGFESFRFATVLYRRCHNDAIYAALLAGGGFVDLLFGRMRFDGGTMTTDVTRKIKVCYIVPRAYPLFNPDKGDYFGGAEFDLYCMATELARNSGFEVSFIVADYGQNDVETIEGVTIFKSHDFNKNVFDGALKTWRAMKRADADIYFLECASPGVPLVAMFCKLHGKSLMYRLAHLFESDGTYVRQHPIMGRLFNWSLRHADAVFGQNVTDEGNLTRTVGVSSRAIPNGHRLPAVQQQTRDTILWVGRDDPLKRPDRFLELARAMPEEHFTMACHSLNKDQHYDDLIAEAGKIPNLRFIRHIPFNQIDSHFQRAKIFVSTADAEGFPNTFIHACKCSTPIISFAVNPDGFIDTYSCGLCCNGDPARLTVSVRFMLENNRYVEYGANARRYAEQYHDIKKIIAEYKSYFIRAAKK
jgi:glycosyltransferase involved in cell wall biosynthesis